MKYLGYNIFKQYLPGSDFNVLKNNTLVNIKPKQIDYYYAEHIVTGFKPANCSNILEMKKHIRDLERHN